MYIICHWLFSSTVPGIVFANALMYCTDDKFCMKIVVAQRQEEERVRRDYEVRKMTEQYERRIKGYESQIGDMVLHIRTRDRQIMAVEEKVRWYFMLCFAVCFRNDTSNRRDPLCDGTPFASRVWFWWIVLTRVSFPKRDMEKERS